MWQSLEFLHLTSSWEGKGMAILKKEAFGLESLLVAGMGHVAQNIVAKRTLLNPKGIQSIVSEISQPNKARGVSGFVSGLRNTITPERGMIKEHIGKAVQEIPRMSHPERVAAYYLSQGNINRVVNSGILEKSPKLRQLAEHYGLPINEIMHMVNGAKLNKSTISELENMYRSSDLGRFGIATGKGLRTLPRNFSVGPTSSQASGEATGNIALGIVEPVSVMVNGIKRLGGDIGISNSIVKKKFQEGGVNLSVKPIFRRAKKLAIAGKRFGPVESAFDNYAMNPVTFMGADYANRAGLAIRKAGIIGK